MTDLAITHRSTVTADQIDHLGHMNVRFYAVNAEAGTAAMVAGFELPPAASLRLVDVYTRHFREQLEGAPLHVRSGIVGADRRRIRIYHELVNDHTDELAASFVHGLVVTGHESTDETGEIPDPLLDVLAARTIDIPARGAPRSLDLAADLRACAPTLDEVRARGLAMRHPRRVMADECDTDGELHISNGPMLTWGGLPTDGSEHGPTLVDGPNGERMGWAAMETRMLLDRVVRVGDHIQAFAATGHLTDKISHRMQWAYDLETRQLLSAFDVVSLAFDTIGRRPMAIPPAIRAAEERILHPEFLPTSVR